MTTAPGREVVLLLTDEIDQSGREVIDVAEVGQRREIIPVSLAQLEALCGACNKESILFVALEDGLDEE